MGLSGVSLGRGATVQVVVTEASGVSLAFGQVTLQVFSEG